jgi:hypothetical protein
MSSNAQIFEHADDEQTKVLGTEREVFASDPIFEKKGGITKRASGGATFDSNLTFGGNVPIDGGLSIFVGGLLGYGIKKMKKRRRVTDV